MSNERTPTGIIAICVCIFACTAVISFASCEARNQAAYHAARQAYYEAIKAGKPVLSLEHLPAN